MEVLKLNKANLAKAVSILKNNGLVVYPTDTCFGLGADATSKLAVDKVFQFKGDRLKPIAIAVADINMAEKYVNLNDNAKNIYLNLLPGALTVISKSKHRVVTRLESNAKTLGVRIPNYPLTLKLIHQFGFPITTTSANATGQKPPYSLTDFLKYTSLSRQKMVDLFLDPGALPERQPSTVVDTTLNELSVIRQGEFKIEGFSFISHSENDTQNIAAQIYKQNKTAKPLIFALQGELGAGKTQFAKGIGKALKIKETVTSPTFNIIKEYPYKSGIFYHIDTWRLESVDELELKSYLKAENILVIEWAQKSRNLLDSLSSAKIIWVNIETIDLNTRKITYA